MRLIIKMKNLFTNKQGSVSIELAAIFGLLAVIFIFTADLGLKASHQFKTDRICASIISIAKQQKFFFSTKNDFNETILLAEDEIAKKLDKLTRSIFIKEFKEEEKYGMSVKFFKYENNIELKLKSDNSYHFGQLKCSEDAKDTIDLVFLRNNDLYSNQIAITVCSEYEPVFAKSISGGIYSKTLITYER